MFDHLLRPVGRDWKTPSRRKPILALHSQRGADTLAPCLAINPKLPTASSET
jgi:hypothetical protein